MISEKSTLLLNFGKLFLLVNFETIWKIKSA